MNANNTRSRIGFSLLSLTVIVLSGAANELPESHDPRPASQVRRPMVRFGRLPQLEYPQAPTVTVDYRDDIGSRGRREGRWTGPIPSPAAIYGDRSLNRATLAGPGCSFAIECDDGDPCSMDICDIAPGTPVGSGSCTHTPIADGEVGDCDDGVFCNGPETCMGRTCVAPGDPCTAGQVCSEDFDNCQSGPCAVDTDCTDNDTCTTEFCTAGVCHRGTPTCGLGADCLNRFCQPGGGCTIANGCANQPCEADQDCLNIPGRCQMPATPLCFKGRCCNGLTCTKKTKLECAGDWLFLHQTPISPPCWLCPRYEAGIGDDPFTAIVGPASLSPASNLMPGTPIRKLGDDFNFCGTASYLSLTEFRFVGGVSNLNNNLVSFEFYDVNGRFIEEISFATPLNELAVQSVEFFSPLVIPCRGFIVAHMLQNLAHDVNARGEFFWVATDGTVNAGDSVDEGTNDKDMLYVDTDLDWSASSPPVAVSNFIKVCGSGVDAGTPCGSNADCESGSCQSRSTDVLAFELVGNPATAPNGACCKEGAVATCDEEPQWTCESENGTFLGLQTVCASCVGGSNNNGPCRTCTGGDNAGLSCIAQSDCPGGSCDLDNDQCPDGGTCVLNATCSSGACCITATGACETGHTPSSCATANGEFQGFGTDCNPNCCEQPPPSYSGADNCEDVGAHHALVPCQSDFDCSFGSGHCDLPTGTCSITITGDNSLATNTFSDPDSCYSPSEVVGYELGWYEGLETFDCSYVRIDLCCTDPVKNPAYRLLYDSCPCGQSILPKRDANLPEEPAEGSGAPYCGDENSWCKYGPLPPGSYYYPVHSKLIGQSGPYQMHVTVTPCPIAACCYMSCDNSSNGVCTVDADCASGERCVPVDGGSSPSRCRRLCDFGECGSGTCDSRCDLMNTLECASISGAFLAPPNRKPPITTCGTICDTGSCCMGPGLCEDSIFDVPVTPEECDGSPFAGRYLGGLYCHPGTCVDSNNAGSYCGIDSECPGGYCNICFECKIPTPCPVCEIRRPGNCQAFDDSVNVRSSDLTVPGGTGAADDFRPAGGSINKVCVWGMYSRLDAANNTVDCGDDVSDNFDVIVYDSAANGLPNMIVGWSAVSGAHVAKAHQDPSAFEDLYQIRIFTYQLTLDSPITGLDSSGNTTYWLEVRNDTDTPAGNNCAWAWSMVDSTAYNDYSAVGFLDYGPNAGRAGDLAFCLDIDFQPGPETLRACCTCEEVCSVTTKRVCDDAGSTWNVSAPECTTCLTVPNPVDECADALAGPVIGDGSYSWDNHCATTDGPNPTPTEFSPAVADLVNDLWYHYVATCDGTVFFSTCSWPVSEDINDFIAAYRDPDNPTVCSCPTQANHLDRLFPEGTGYDRNCFFGGALIEGPATAGDCFLIRVGGFGGQGGEIGQGTLYVSCSLHVTPPPARGDDNCQTSTGDLGGPCTTDADCPTPGAACGTKSRYVSITPTNAAIAGGTSIKVEIVSMPQFPSMVGDVYYAGPEQSIPNSPGPAHRGAPLQCTATPNSQTWTTGVLHLFGPAIVPGSTYNVSMCDTTGTSCSLPLLVATAKWGDVFRPFGGSSQPNFADVSRIVDKFQNLASAPITPRVDLVGPGNPGQPNTPNQIANFADISADVTAFMGLPFPFIVQSCP